MKKSLRLLFLAASVTTMGIAATAPILVSCANSSSSKIYFDANNQELTVNNSKLVFDDANNNLFTAYKNIVSDTSSKLDEYKTNLETLCNDYLSSLNLENLQISFDFDKVDIKGWSISIPTTITSTSSREDNPVLWCKATKVVFPEKDIDQFLENNKYSVKASEAFPGYSLGDIVTDLKSILTLDKSSTTYQDFFSRMTTVPSGTFIFQASDFSKPIYEETTSDDGTTSLNILIFTEEKGLGLLVIENDNEVSEIEPSTQLKNTFGQDVTNEWDEISESDLPSSVDKIEFSTLTASPSTTVLSSYDYALSMSEITSKLSTYTGTNFLSNLKEDLDFFFKSYLTELETSWNETGLLLNSVFVADNLTVKDQTISGSIAMEIKNISNGTKKITLPISNEIVSINSKSTISIIITFNNSSVKPYLTASTSTSNQAYLSTAFNNVTLKATQVTTSTDTNGDKTESTKTLFEKSYEDYINVFPYSYNMKTIITNVGYGNTIASSKSLLDSSLNALTQSDLKNAKINEIETIYQNTITGVNVAQSLLTKITSNPTVFDFLQDISSEVNKLVYLFTSDSNLSSIVSDMFSTKSASEYLYANLSKIISYMEELAKTAPQLTYIIDMLKIINNNNQTPEQMKEWVTSIKDLYPTLEKLLGANLKWVMPLLNTVMTSISNDNPPIIALIFNNMEDIFSFVLSDDNSSNLDSNLVTLLKSVYNYLNAIVKYSSSSSTSTNADKYKTIKVLDILSYELTATDRGSTLLTLLSSVFQIIQPDSTIPNLLTTINSMIGNQIKIPSTIYDYSSATWNNVLDSKSTSVTSYRVKEGTGTSYKLSTYFGKIIDSFLNVTVGSDTTTTPIATVLNNYVNISTTSNTFTYDASTHTVTQDLTMRMNFTDTITINTLPICVFLDNISLNIAIGSLGSVSTATKTTSTTDGYTTISSNKANINVSNLDSLVSGFLPSGLSSLLKINGISLDLGSIFPTDIVIKSNNFVDLNYKATNAKLTPLVDSKTGAINWSYQANENVTISYNDETNGILASSNLKYKRNANSSLASTMYYGSKFQTGKSGNSLIDGFLPSSGYLGVDVSAKVLFVTLNIKIGLFPLLADFSGNYSKSIMVSTNLSNPTTIDNYNSKVYVPNAKITQKQTTTAFTSYLSTLIDTYGQWVAGTDGTTKFSLKSGHDLDTQLKNYFDFGSAFTDNEYVTYKYGFDAISYKLLNDTYQYTFHIYLSTPTNYTTLVDGTTASKSSLVTTISFNVTSNKAPTGTK